MAWTWILSRNPKHFDPGGRPRSASLVLDLLLKAKQKSKVTMYAILILSRQALRNARFNKTVSQIGEMPINRRIFGYTGATFRPTCQDLFAITKSYRIGA